MKNILTLFISLLFLNFAQADGLFVPPTANGTALVGQLPGTTTNDSACSTCVGWSNIADVSAGSAVVLSNNTAKTVVSLAIPSAGDYLITGMVGFTGGASTSVTALNAGLSTTTDTLPASSRQVSLGYATVTIFANNNQAFTLPPIEVKMSASGTANVVALCVFAVAACNGYGTLSIQRIR